jgi:hypothetical protein
VGLRGRGAGWRQEERSGGEVMVVLLERDGVWGLVEDQDFGLEGGNCQSVDDETANAQSCDSIGQRN